ncbi:LysR family transcriptional regulator [Ralstonia sp. UBA689]|uniref:LysR family transcriptional regulator n=1 Tax=Ralstonia sp. UBA689 TaxID=1947373 RepID=UPI0025D9360A|nr:LysR family transcriptional regulator [Ralstonia sp. UBA689]
MTFDGQLFSGITLLAAVAESGSFVRAADALGLSPSGVSRAVSRLEARIGVRLIERTTRSLTLTDEGRRLYEQVGPHLNGIAEAAAMASGAAGAVQGRLRVNVDPFFSRIALATPVVGFLDRHPDLSLELIMRDDVGDLVADGFDLAVRFGPPPVGSFVARKLIETRIVTVASPGYIARHGRPAHPREVAEHQRILFYNPVTGRPYEWEFWREAERVEIRPAGRLMVSDVRTMHAACVAGAGIAQVMALGTEELRRSGQLVDLFPDWPDERFALYALYPSRRYLPAKVHAFIDFCVENLPSA